MKFIQSLILLIVALFALSSASYTGFNITDSTQKCSFALPSTGACTSNAKCGSNSNSTFAYTISQTKGASNVNNYTINGFSDSKCSPVANNLFNSTFICNPNKAVTVKVNTNSVDVTCNEQNDSSSASATMISFVVLVAALIASLL